MCVQRLEPQTVAETEPGNMSLVEYSRYVVGLLQSRSSGMHVARGVRRDARSNLSLTSTTVPNTIALHATIIVIG